MLSHCTVGLDPIGGFGLHDLVEAVVGHDLGDKQLGRANVVERKRLDLGDVDPHLAMDARALDAHDDAEVRREPRRICRQDDSVKCLTRR